MNKKVVGIVIGLMAVAAIGSASPSACVPNGAVVVGASAVSSVSCGPLVFSNFSATVIQPPGGSATITLAPFGESEFDDSTGTVFLTFDPNMIVPAGAVEDIHFYFTVTGAVSQVDLSVGNTPGAAITEVYCSTPIPTSGGNTNQCTASGAGSVNGSLSAGAGGSNPGTPFNTVSTLYIFKDIQLNNTSGQTEELSTFTQSFHTPVPEPVTLSMMGIGLLGIGLMRRRQQGKK